MNSPHASRFVPSPNRDARAEPVRFLILHYTGMADEEAALARLASPESRVSAHYFVRTDGEIIQMVPEEDRAWHAGVSRWQGRSALNGSSIGIEIHNPGHDFGCPPYPPLQMEAVVRLVGCIARRHGIDRADVLGHSDIAPTRKQDPGELFDWALLAAHGLALGPPSRLLADPGWPDAAFGLALERFGYDISDLAAATRAFQRRFRPARVDGIIDGETRALLFTLQVEEEARLQASGGVCRRP